MRVRGQGRASPRQQGETRQMFRKLLSVRKMNCDSRRIFIAITKCLISMLATSPPGACAQYASSSGIRQSISNVSGQNPATQGSVPSGAATKETIQLTLRDAVNMALRYNLGTIESGENERAARGERLLA